jgi:hypothetical protein
LEDSIGVSGDHGTKDFQNDDDEQNVVYRLDHAIGKERPGREDANNAENQRSDGNSKKEDTQDDMEDIFHAFRPPCGNNAFR